MHFDENQYDSTALMRMLEVAQQLSRPFELRALLEQIIDAGRDVLQADRGSVFLYDDQLRELYTAVAHGVKGIRFSIDKGIAGECVRTGMIINVPDCYADDRFNKDVDRETGYRTNCLITVPLIDMDDQMVGVMQLLNAKRGHFNREDEKLAVLLASQAASAIQRVVLLGDRDERLKLERELDLARRIQMGVLPRQVPQCPGYDLAMYSEPAEQTGGDILDIVEMPESVSIAGYPTVGGVTCGEKGGDKNENGRGTLPLFLLLADATGHGVGPAISVTQVRAMLRLGLRLSAGLDDLFTHINSQLTADLASDRFVTAFLGILEPSRNAIYYHAAGQAPLLHYHAADQTCDVLLASTIPLGIMDDPPLDVAEPVQMEPGDVFALLTDGFYEYQNPEGEEMGDQRVADVIRQHREKSAQEILNAILESLTDYAQGMPQLDDTTAIILKRTV